MTDQDLIKLYQDQQDALGDGCGDGNCVIKKPVGMHTNGGCRCLYNLDFMGRQRVGVMLQVSQKMAGRIESLVKERDELGRKLNTARYGQPDFAWSIHEEAMADLRVKLANAVEAIKQSIQKWESPHYGDENIKIDNAFDGFELLRATLAELEGKE